MTLRRPFTQSVLFGEAAEEWARVGSPSMAAHCAREAVRSAEEPALLRELEHALPARPPVPRSHGERRVTFYGRIERATGLAILFHVTFRQPPGAIRAAVGHTFWFPRRSVSLFRDRDGNVVCDVPVRFIEEQLAKAAIARTQHRNRFPDE